MTDYTITTDFGAKDSLPSGNAAKVIKGSEFTTEFTNIKTAVNSKADSVSPTFTGDTALNGTTTFGPDGTSTFNGTVNFTKDVTFDTDTMFVDVSENRVGIGTSSPAYELDVTGSAQLSGGDLILRGDSTDADTQSIRFENVVNDGRSAYIRADYNTDSSGNAISLVFGTNPPASDGSDRMVIDSSGNVGIGTTSPSADLHINNTTGSELRIDTTGGSNVDSVLNFRENGVDRASLYWDGADNDLYLETTAGDIALLPNGNVGIGTTNPSRVLHVKGSNDTVRLESTGSNTKIEMVNTGSTTNEFGFKSNNFFVAHGGTERMRIDSAGNVLVGKTATGFGTAGIELFHDNQVYATSTTHGLAVNRLSTDGAIAKFYRDSATVGSIGTRAAFLNIGSGDTGLLFNSTADRIQPESTTGGARDAAIDLGGSSTRFKDLYLSGGVYLGGTDSAHKLDDYEEGTWTPIVQGSTSGTASYTPNQANYTKIGNVVYFQCYLTYVRFDTHNIVGEVQIGGLPFSSAKLGRVQIGHTNMTNSDENTNQIAGYTSGTVVSLRKGSSGSSITDSDLITSQTTIMVSGVYTTNA